MPGRYCTRSVIEYHRQWYSSGEAFGGGLTGWRSSTRGFKSIISLCECRVSITVSLLMELGSGVTVVKTVLFDIAIANCCSAPKEDVNLSIIAGFILDKKKLQLVKYVKENGKRKNRCFRRLDAGKWSRGDASVLKHVDYAKNNEARNLDLRA